MLGFQVSHLTSGILAQPVELIFHIFVGEKTCVMCFSPAKMEFINNTSCCYFRYDFFPLAELLLAHAIEFCPSTFSWHSLETAVISEFAMPRMSVKRLCCSLKPAPLTSLNSELCVSLDESWASNPGPSDSCLSSQCLCQSPLSYEALFDALRK